MRIDVLTTFPRMFEGPLDESIVRRARERGLVQIGIHDIRAFATDRHRTTDDAPYGGGAGMVMRPEPVFAAVESIVGAEPEAAACRPKIILMTPQGRVFDQRVARELAGLDHLVFVCGHYEGVDERIRDHLVTDEISVGDFVVTGGELPAMLVIDAIVRLVPGVLGSEASLAEESHAEGLLEYPHYTRPPEFRGWRVPEVLLSGNHSAIAAWRRQQALERTRRRRPDMLAAADLSSADRRYLASIGAPEWLRPEDAPVERRPRRRKAPRIESAE